MDVDDLWYKRDGSPSARHGKGSRWQARWRDPAGRQHGKVFARKLDAERHLAMVAADKARGKYIDPAAGKALLRNFAAGWQESLACGPSSLAVISARLDNQILPWLGDYQLAALQPSVISSWFAGRQRKVSDRYARQCLGTLSSLLAAAVDDGLIGANPARARSVRPPRRSGGSKVVPWTAQMVAEMTAAIGPQLRALVICGAAEGLRQGELLGLAASDIDFLRRVIHVRRQVRMVGSCLVFCLPKGGKTRDVPLADSAGLALARHIEDFPPVRVKLPWERADGKLVAKDLMFTRDGRAWWGGDLNRRAWRPALEAAGIEHGARSGDGCHALRHYAASSWLDGGCTINDVASYLGHSDPGFTLRTYTHLMPSAPERMRKAADSALAAACDENVPAKSVKP